MRNGVLLNALFVEYYSECMERCMRFDDIKAIERVMELLKHELPTDDKISEDETVTKSQEN